MIQKRSIKLKHWHCFWYSEKTLQFDFKIWSYLRLPTDQYDQLNLMEQKSKTSSPSHVSTTRLAAFTVPESVQKQHENGAEAHSRPYQDLAAVSRWLLHSGLLSCARKTTYRPVPGDEAAAQRLAREPGVWSRAVTRCQFRGGRLSGKQNRSRHSLLHPELLSLQCYPVRDISLKENPKKKSNLT